MILVQVSSLLTLVLTEFVDSESTLPCRANCASNIPEPCIMFSGRYKSQLVEGSGTGYLRTACD
jgi:hypothetical protein